VVVKVASQMVVMVQMVALVVEELLQVEQVVVQEIPQAHLRVKVTMEEQEQQEAVFMLQVEEVVQVLLV
tara:strand:+ start:36 stop:242 length:207 start_codon:yes stop_codon:yes gene_type:complete